jgi:small subunit ribosomal protein S9
MAHTRRTIRANKKVNKSQRLSEVKELMSSVAPKGEYTEAIGRRNTAVARVRVYSSKKNEVLVNGRPSEEYFGTDELRSKAMQALLIDEQKNTYTVSAYVKGSGPNAQAESIRLGVARALVEIDEELRSPLKAKGFLKRDPRSVERKKFGLLKARKKPAWVKR